MSHIPEDLVSEIIERTDIIDIIGSYIPVKQRGSEYWACCPFHKEKTPSFKIDASRQTYYCFGCKVKGNAVTFIKEHENLDFVGAIRFLAHRANITIPENNYNNGQNTKKRSHKEKMFLLLDDVAKWLQKNLREKHGEIARNYLKKRQLPLVDAVRFGLGFAPNGWDLMLKWGEEQGYTRQELIDAGLLIYREPENGKPERIYDRFRNRLMFPICDELGKTIGFSGRILISDKKQAKYINSPETLLFHKSKVLYGIHHARQFLKETGHALICEGQLDVIACHRAGVINAIAPQGTAFTEDQAKLLKRFTNHLIFAFDADTAGRKAALRSIEIALAADMTAQAIELPDGEDPDGILNKSGATALKEQMTQAIDALPFILRSAQTQYDLKKPEGKAEIVDMMLRIVVAIPNPVTRAASTQWIAEKLHLPESAVFAIQDKILAEKARFSQREEQRNLRHKKLETNQTSNTSTNNEPAIDDTNFDAEYFEDQDLLDIPDDNSPPPFPIANSAKFTDDDVFPIPTQNSFNKNKGFGFKYSNKFGKSRKPREIPTPNRPSHNLGIASTSQRDLFDLAVHYEFLAHELTRILPQELIVDNAIGWTLSLVIAMVEQGEWALIRNELKNSDKLLTQEPELIKVLDNSNYAHLDPNNYEEYKQDHIKKQLRKAMTDCLRNMQIVALEKRQQKRLKKIPEEADLKKQIIIMKEIQEAGKKIQNLKNEMIEKDES